MKGQPLKPALWTDKGPKFTLSLKKETLSQETKTKMLRIGPFCWNQAELIIKLFYHAMAKLFYHAGNTQDSHRRSLPRRVLTNE